MDNSCVYPWTPSPIDSAPAIRANGPYKFLSFVSSGLEASSKVVTYTRALIPSISINCCAVLASSLGKLVENATLDPSLKGPLIWRLCAALSIATAFLFASINSARWDVEKVFENVYLFMSELPFNTDPSGLRNIGI